MTKIKYLIKYLLYLFFVTTYSIVEVIAIILCEYYYNPV